MKSGLSHNTGSFLLSQDLPEPHSLLEKMSISSYLRETTEHCLKQQLPHCKNPCGREHIQSSVLITLLCLMCVPEKVVNFNHRGSTAQGRAVEKEGRLQ